MSSEPSSAETRAVSGFMKAAVSLVRPAGPNDICDSKFMEDLERLKDLRSFLIEHAIVPDDQASAALTFGPLNLLRYSQQGRAPTENEWESVEKHTQLLFAVLNEPLKRKFLIGRIPRWVAALPIGFAIAAISALMLAIIAPSIHLFGSQAGTNVFPFYLVWLLCLGAIGSVAFIGMNALAVQQDITFDLTNARLMSLRIVLGALFALVLALPFGYDSFLAFCELIGTGPRGTNIPGPGGERTSMYATITEQAIMLLLPFVLGFSTSLVILILNRMVEAIQVFFGKSSGGPSGATR